LAEGPLIAPVVVVVGVLVTGVGETVVEVGVVVGPGVVVRAGEVGSRAVVVVSVGVGGAGAEPVAVASVVVDPAGGAVDPLGGALAACALRAAVPAMIPPVTPLEMASVPATSDTRVRQPPRERGVRGLRCMPPTFSRTAERRR
jgi:hypothetical protein